MKTAIVPALDPKTYVAHPLHTEERSWAETNCYVDLWIETLHGLGYEPYAAMPFTIAIDFEGDQFTFFKFPLDDIFELYGIETVELNVWNKMLGHVEEQVGMGRPFIVEMDAFYLPDTAGTSYKAEHVKTSIAIQMIDVEQQRLGYFHGASYYELSGDDFVGVFRLKPELKDPNILPPYVEVAKTAVRPALRGDALVRASVGLLRKHLARRPVTNPFTRYRARFEKDLPWVTGGDLGLFHGYAFATMRQFGACFEVASKYLRWLEKNGEKDLEPIAAKLGEISESAKSLQFKMARAVRNKKPVDVAIVDQIAAAWESATTALDARYR